MTPKEPLRIGIGGPVGSGKTALMDWLCKEMRGRLELVAITNDIYTREDAEFLTRSGALPAERIRGVETGGCPHTAIREDASINLAAIAEMTRLFPQIDIVLIESGGDNLAATFSPELADLTIYVIDLAGRDHPWDSRGGVKLAFALDQFAIDVEGATALDIGASTGGFTDVLLAKGAARVHAVDVGRGQLAWKLRQDPRVVVHESTNARYLSRAEIPEPIDLVTCDASFIGLATVLPAPLALTADRALLIGLIKP